MKLIVGGWVIVLLTMLFPCSAFTGEELDEHLHFLEPLLSKEWIGGYVGSDSPDIKIVLRFETILDGRAVSYVREADAVSFSNLTQFYWNPNIKKVCFLSLSNKGIVGEGVACLTDDTIVLLGKSHYPDKTTEFKTTLNIDQRGTLIDKFHRMENSEWVQGHLQEFVAKE